MEDDIQYQARPCLCSKCKKKFDGRYIQWSGSVFELKAVCPKCYKEEKEALLHENQNSKEEK